MALLGAKSEGVWPQMGQELGGSNHRAKLGLFVVSDKRGRV